MNFLKLNRTALGLLIGTLAWSSLAPAQTVQDTTVKYTYYPLGELKTRLGALNEDTTYEYDILWRLTRRTEPPLANGNRQMTAFAYDGLNQLISVNDYRNSKTSYGIDGLGNQLKLTSPDTGIANRTFDAAGNLATQTDARGKLTIYAYDALNRVTSNTFQSGIPSTFEYDGGATGAPADIGKLTKMIDESGETTFTHGGKGRLQVKVQLIKSTNGSSATLTTSYTYGAEGGALGKVASMTYPSGNRINYIYDEAGLLNSLTLNRANGYGGTSEASTTVLLNDIDYAATGNVASWTWGQGSVYLRTFDLDGRLTTYPIGDPAAGGATRTVKYDASNRITAITHAGGATPSAFNQTYGYDLQDHIISYAGNGTSKDYRYDVTGNRYRQGVNGTLYYLGIEGTTNRLYFAYDPAGDITNTFDAAGNIIKRNATTYTYSDRGRMSSSTGAFGRTDYLYNGAGQRVSKTNASIATGVNYYAYDEEGKLLGEYKGDSQPLQETIYLGEQPVAVVANDVYYVYADHINTPRVLTKNSDSTVVWRWDNADPFGVGSPLASAVANGGAAMLYNPRFPGQLFDSETGTHYNYFRDYDPQTGRYVQSDPIGLGGGINTYGYVGGNPLTYIDPRGLNGCAWVGPVLVCKNSPPPGLVDPLDLPSPASGSGTNPIDEVMRGSAALALRLLGPTIVAIANICQSSEEEPSKEACDAQWRRGRDFCIGKYYNGDKKPGRTGGGKNVTDIDLESCIRGQVTQACGGSRIE
jgi:RHS repeat-associated protein